MWLHAGDAERLEEGTPLTITLRVARPDGPSEVVDLKIVYLVKTGEDVRALGPCAPRVPYSIQQRDAAD